MLDLGDRTSIYQPEQKGLIFPRELQTNDLAELRDHRKRHLVAACRAFAGWGLDFGFAGHLTIRDPEHPELYWTNPMAVHFAQVKLSNLILVDHDGHVVEGDYAVNQAGFVIHSAVHAEHPDILAMCHAHTVYGSAYASLGRPARADHPGTRARSSRTMRCSPRSRARSRSNAERASPWPTPSRE